MIAQTRLWLTYLLAGLLAEHAAASACMLPAASSDADCESLCDGCRCAGGPWQVLEQHSHHTGAANFTLRLVKIVDAHSTHA